MLHFSWVGIFGRLNMSGNTWALPPIGSKPSVLLRAASGPTTATPAEGAEDHPVLRRYANAVGLDLTVNMLVAVECQLFATRKRLLVVPPGPFPGTRAQPAIRLDRDGASLTYLDHIAAPDVPVEMMHIALANGRFVLGDVHLDDDGDIDGFIAAFGPAAQRVPDDLARDVLQPG